MAAVRADDEPSFMEHEGRFRNIAWSYLRSVLKPERGDWIVALDADEILVVDGDLRAALAEVSPRARSLNVPIDECWELDPPRRRVDGHWGSITGARLFRWLPGVPIADKEMGCGSVPLDGHQVTVDNPRIMHLGYVRAEDRVAKYERYRGRSGHSGAHVASILATPVLVPVGGVE